VLLCYGGAFTPSTDPAGGWEEAVNFVNVDFDLFILHRELVKMVKGVSSMSLQLSQSGELMDGVGQVASTIPDSPGTPTQDWRSMLAVS